MPVERVLVLRRVSGATTARLTTVPLPPQSRLRWNQHFAATQTSLMKRQQVKPLLSLSLGRQTVGQML